MQINVLYDNGAANLPLGFTDGIEAAVKYLQDHINSNVTFNLHVGYGSVHGQPVLGLAGYQNQLNNVSYDNLVTALTSHATSADDLAAVHSLAATNPLPAGSQLQIAQVEALALGLTSGSADVYIGFNQNVQWDYNAGNGVPTGTTDFVAQAINEITASMGRAFTNSIGGQFQPLQLFDYNGVPANGQVHHQFNITQDGYFSLDSGKTDLVHFNHTPGFIDKGSWDITQGPDAFNAVLTTGTTNTVSDTDLKVMDILGFDLGSSTPPPTGGGSTPPPTGGGSTPPPTGGGSTPPPTGGGSTPPPTGGGSTPPPTGGGSTPTGGAVGTELFGLMSSGTATADQTAAWPKFAADQLAFYQKIGVASPDLGVWEAFGMAFSTAGKFAALNALSTADFAKTAWHDAFGADPTSTQVDFVNAQVQSHANFFTANHLYGADTNPAVALTIAHGATFGILVGIAEFNGTHTHIV